VPLALCATASSLTRSAARAWLGTMIALTIYTPVYFETVLA